MKKLIKFICAAIAATFALASAQATTYRLREGSNAESPYSFSDSNNWTVDDQPASTYPQSGDTIWLGIYSSSHQGYISLAGNYTVSDFTYQYNRLYLYRDSSASDQVSLTFTGTVGGSAYQHYYIYDGAKFIAGAQSSLKGALWDDNPSVFGIYNGGEVDVFGTIQSRHTTYNIEAGATLVFSPSTYQNFTSSSVNGNAGDVFNVTGGNVNFSNGLTVTGGNSAYANAINQSGGTITFGGNFTSAATDWTYTFSGGTLAITENATFGSNIALTISASASVALDVASGKTFSAANFTADSTATIAKTGAGIFAYAPTAVAIAVNEGGIGFASASTYDLSRVSFAANTTIALNSLGATVSATSATIDNAVFTANLSGATAGTVVLNSSDSGLLAKAKTDLAKSVSEGFELVVSDTSLSIEVQSSYNFGGSGDILDASCWGGSLPGADAEVAITGATTVATLSTGTFPAWSSIEVKDGATLRIEVNASLPPITLNKTATLAIDGNASVTLANASDLSGIATAQQIPVLSIASGATLNVPGGMKFSNVNISLAGTIASTTAGGITFGYAAAGETTYIGLASNGGTISIMPGSGDYNTSRLQFCCPEVGGTVNAAGSLILANSTILPEYVRSGVTYKLCTDYQIGFYVGVNNPASIPFELVFDNTTWGALGSFYVKGGGTFRLANGGAYRNFESVGYWGRYAQIAENGRIVVGAGCEFRMNALGDYGTHALEVLPASTGHQAIIVDDGGVFETYRFSGNDKAVFAASNSVYTIYMPSIYNEHYSQSSQTTTIYDTTNIPFAGFASVDVAQNCTLTFSTRNKVFWDEGQFGDDSGERVVALADVPITGGGSIALSNDNVNVFGVIVTCGENTATGTAGVVPPAAGKGATTLYFADGANWAGTVTAGGFATTNLVDATAACTNAFGTLDLAADTTLKLRVWKTGGVIVRHDGLNVNTYANNGGRLVLEAMDEPLGPGDKLILGAIGAGSPLPAMLPSWTAERNHDGNLSVRYLSGLSVIIR